MKPINKTKNPYTLGIILLLAVLCVFLVMTFTSKKIHSTASFEQISQAMTEAVDPGLYPKQDVQKLRRDLKLDPSLAKNIAWYRLEDAMSANEMLIVEFDASGQEALESAAQSRQEAMYTLYEGYAPEQAALMSDALINFQDNYGLYYTGNDPQKINEAFMQALRRE